MQHYAVILGLEGSAVLLLVPVRIAVLLHKLALLVALALGHLEVKLILVLEIRLEPQLIEHVALLMVILGPELVILLLLQQSQMLPGLQLRPFPVFALGDAVLEC